MSVKDKKPSIPEGDDSENKPVSWGVSTEGGSISSRDFPSGHGSVHMNGPSGGYTLYVSGFDHDGYPKVHKWYDDD